ncbi:MAG: ABC transporter permease subunit, partial [Candidatus Bathyarchaeia archaeon]
MKSREIPVLFIASHGPVVGLLAWVRLICSCIIMSAGRIVTKDRISLLFAVGALAFAGFMLASGFYIYLIALTSWEKVAPQFLSGRVLGALLISVSSSFIVGVLAVVAGVPFAYFLAYGDFRFKSTLETLMVDLPQTFPPVTVGLVYLILFGAGSPVNIAFTFAAVVIAKFYVSSPFMVGFAARRFREVKARRLDLIARSLGANTRQLLFRIIIPLSRRDLLAGFSLTWARAMGELGATMVFAGIIPWRTEVIPTLVYSVSQAEPNTAIAAAVVA